MNDDDILNLLDSDDRYNCGMIISNPEGMSLIQASYDTLKAELDIDPKRYWHEGAHPLESVLAKYRQQGYRVEFIGQDEGNSIYTVIRTYLILSSDTLIQLLMHWMYPER